MSQPCVYEDAALSLLVTIENDFANPDDESGLGGDSGVTSDKLLWVAIEQGLLGADINDTITTVTLKAARFADTALPVICIGTEKMKITAGFGTTSLTVERNYDNTTPAAHSENDSVILCYDITAAKIVADDNDGTDEAAWMKYCLAPGGTPDGSYNTHPAELALGSLGYNESVQINRRLIVPASTGPQKKTDLLHDTTGTLTEHSF